MNTQDKWVYAHELVERGETQKRVAEILGVSPTTVASYLFKAKFEIERRKRARDPRVVGDLNLPFRVRNGLHNAGVVNLTFEEFFRKVKSPQWLINHCSNFGRQSMLTLVKHLREQDAKATDAWVEKDITFSLADDSFMKRKPASIQRVRHLQSLIARLEDRLDTLTEATSKEMRAEQRAWERRVDMEQRKALAVALGERTGLDVHWTQVMQDDKYVYFHNWEYPDDVELYEKPLATTAEPWDDVPYEKSVFVR